MKQLGILDSAFINLEQGNTPQHVGGLGIYDPSTAEGGFVRFKQVIANFEQRLRRMPLFRTRLVEVPGGIDRPYWLKDANFDIEFHLRHIALPEPGDWRQLCIQVARLHAHPLDMSRPLWEAYIIEGLDSMTDLPAGSFAIYTKMHHSLVDGAGGASFMSALHDLSPNPEVLEQEAEEPLLVDRNPSSATLLSRAVVNRVKNGVSIARGTAELVKDLGKFALEVARDEVTMPDVQSPRTRFNNPVGPHRVFDAVDFPIAELKEIKDTAGVKLNDVALAVVGAAMQRYLVAKGEAPELPLAASLPVNMRTRRGETGENNQVGAIFSSLHTDIVDPIERLRAINSSTTEAKEFGESSPLVDTLKIAGVFSPLLSKTVASMWTEGHWSRMIPLNTSTVITNVPGPNFDLFCAGARLVKYHGMGVLTPGVGLFHTVFSQSDRVNLSVLGDRECLPDPSFYIECLRESYAELLAATRGEKTKPKRKKAAGKKPSADKKAAKKAPTKRKAASKSSARARPKTRRKQGRAAPKLNVVN